MTGIELVLAVIPLVISAAEHRKKAVRFVKTIASQSAKAEKELLFFYDLYDELSLLANTLTGVFQRLPHPIDLRESITLDSNHQQAINDVLGSKAEHFHIVLERVLQNVDNVISDRSLGLKRSDVSLYSSRPFCKRLEHFKKAIERGETTSTLCERLIFTGNDKSRTSAIQKIQKDNLTLERVLRGVLTSDQIQTHQMKKNKPYAPKLRKFSEPLFRTMVEKWPKSCTYHTQHEARLCLWNCCSKDRCSRESDSVDMVVSVTGIDQDGAAWQESLILIPDDEQNSSSRQTIVQFANDSQATPNREARSPPDRDINPESLCRLINQAYEHQAALQMIFNNGKLWHDRPRRPSLDIRKQRDVTLKDFLENSQRSFTLKDKWTLAVILSHAALHCCNGPWLEQDWSKEHICFFKTDQSVRPDLSRPFLKILFDDKPEHDQTMAEDFAIHPNPSLLSLGILLLEVYLAHPIESKWSEDDLTNGVQNENTNLTTALRLLQDSEGDLYEGYRAAIKACLTCEAPGSSPEEFAKTVYCDIVQPLESELQHGFHITVEDFQLAHNSGR